MIFNESYFSCWNTQKEKFKKNYFYSVLDFSGRNFRIFCCDLKCGHHKEFDVTTCSFLSFLYLSRDLSFTVSTFFSVLLFPHPAFFCCNFWISVATRKFLGVPKQSNSQQFQFIQIQSRQLQLNSSLSCKYSTKSSTMHHIQNLSTRTN